VRAPLVKTISTFFFIGYLPLVPGTFASLAGMGVFACVKESPERYMVSLALLTALGFLTAGRAEKLFGKKDHRSIVIDEVAGMMLSVGFLPRDYRLYVLGFFLFRLLDTVKPYPASLLQEREGAFGVMSDDIVAGIYTNLILQVVARLP